MTSLEKNMYFVPNRYFVHGKTLYVSFNVAVIPSDMSVTNADVYIPLKHHTTPVRLKCEEISSGWSEELMSNGFRPTRENSALNIQGGAYQSEVVFPVMNKMEQWRFQSKLNHGLFLLQLEEASSLFSINNPPYLVVSTL